MEDYQARKRKEFQDNKARNKEDNAVSRARYNAMDKAIKSLKERMEYNQKYDKLVEDTREYKAYHQSASEMKAVDIESAKAKPQTLSGADEAALKQIDKDLKEFKAMSQNDFQAEGEYEKQATKVIAGAAVKEALENGQLDPGRLKVEYVKNQNSIEKNPAFQSWIKGAVEGGRKSELGKMSPDELQADFVKGIAKNMSKESAKTVEKAQTKEKSAKEKAGKEKATKEKTKAKQPKVKKPLEKNGLKV